MWFVPRVLLVALLLLFLVDGLPIASAAVPSLTIQPTPSTQVTLPIGVVLTPNISAQVAQTDAQGRTLPVANVDVIFTAPSTGASGTFGSTKQASVTAKTNSAGVATAPAFTANHTLGSYAISVATAGATTVNIAVKNSENPALADSINWVGNPSLVFINHVLQPPLAVQVLNSSGQPLIGMTVTFQAPSS